MLERVLEPEAMDSEEEASEYDAMNHVAVNETFVDDFIAAMRAHGLDAAPRAGGSPVAVLDCGTGTALIPLALVRRDVSVRIAAVDLSEEMLRVARRNVERAGCGDQIEIRSGDCKALPFGGGLFDAVMSNSIVHHLPEPAGAIAEMARVVRPGGVLFVRDLLRPDSVERVEELVETYAAGETERQRQLFRDSLRAALTLDEVRDMVAGVGLSPEIVRRTSDRHWTIAGQMGGSI